MGGSPKVQCGRRRADGQPCRRGAGWATATPGTGPCKYHGGIKRGKHGEVADKRVKSGFYSANLAEQTAQVDARIADKEKRHATARRVLAGMFAAFERTLDPDKSTDDQRAAFMWTHGQAMLDAWASYERTAEGVRVSVTSTVLPLPDAAEAFQSIGRAMAEEFQDYDPALTPAEHCKRILDRAMVGAHQGMSEARMLAEHGGET